jgi:hypothetical protein
MLVLLAGMPRSGSTFSFNVVREVLRVRGRIHQEACEDIIGAVHRSNGADHVLIKAHRLDATSGELAKAGAMRIIITVRRVEDAMASWFDAFDALPEATALQIMRDWLCLFRHLRFQALVVSYEEIDRHPWFATWRIARAICPGIGPAETIKIARRFSKAEVKRQADQLVLGGSEVTDVGFSYFDNATFFHRRHVASLVSRPAEERLTHERLVRIREGLANEIAGTGAESFY